MRRRPYRFVVVKDKDSIPAVEPDRRFPSAVCAYLIAQPGDTCKLSFTVRNIASQNFGDTAADSVFSTGTAEFQITSEEASDVDILLFETLGNDATLLVVDL